MEAERALKTIESLLLGGPLPEGWTVTTGVERLVHSYIINCQKKEAEQSRKIARLEATIDTLIERNAQKG